MRECGTTITPRRGALKDRRARTEAMPWDFGKLGPVGGGADVGEGDEGGVSGSGVWRASIHRRRLGHRLLIADFEPIDARGGEMIEGFDAGGDERRP